MTQNHALTITLKKPWRNLRADEHFAFFPGINIVVGDQGSGKTSLLQLITCPKDYKLHLPKDFRDYRVPRTNREWALAHIDFYKDHPANHNGECPDTMGGFAAMFHAFHSSHGESIQIIHLQVENHGQQPVVLFLSFAVSRVSVA